MLTPEERSRITEELADALVDAEFPRQRVRDVFPDKIDYAVILANGTNVPRDLAVLSVSACLASGWSRTPPMLATLLRYLIDVRGVGDLAALLARVIQRVDPNLSVYQATWLLDNSRPFFDRHELRKKARLLVEGNGRSVLMVAGDDSGYGRSYSLDFLAHVASNRPDDVGVLAAAVGEGGGPSYTVESLLGEFAAQLSIAEPFPPRTRASYAESAVLWLLRPLVAPGPRWLIVLDGFGQDGVAPEVHETIQRLARQVATVPAYRNRVRLVLLGYPPPVVPRLPVVDLLAEKLPGVSQANLLTETLAPAAGIGLDDLLPCLEAWNALRRAECVPTMAPDELAKLADGLLARAPATGKARLAALHAQLLSLLELSEGDLDAAI